MNPFIRQCDKKDCKNYSQLNNYQPFLYINCMYCKHNSIYSNIDFYEKTTEILIESVNNK